MLDTGKSIEGGLIGCAVGDALGLHREGLSAARANKMFSCLDRYYFLGKYGATSDDYDHACMTVEALCAAGGNAEVFARELARRIKVWAACVPGGIGLATLRSSFKLWFGIDPRKAGVFSAGNGPAMRSHILGICIQDVAQLVSFVRASTRITHLDPKAFTGALVVALASRHSVIAQKVDAAAFLADIREVMQDADCDLTFMETLQETIASVGRHETTTDFARRLYPKGVSGYMYQTVPAVIHAWLSQSEDYADAVKSIISCGGDADTTGSILGGIIGARVGMDGIPKNWRENLILWPRTQITVESLAAVVAAGRTDHLQVPAWKYLMRNAWFDAVVIMHGFRRLAPPY